VPRALLHGRYPTRGGREPDGCDKIFQRIPADQGIPGIRSPLFALSTTSGGRYDRISKAILGEATKSTPTLEQGVYVSSKRKSPPPWNLCTPFNYFDELKIPVSEHP
jgi:hypothetical protein